MTRTRLVVGGSLLALVAVLALAFRFDPHDLRSAAVGRPAAAFDLARLDGTGRVSLAGLAGKVVVVNFFASWCVPCREEHPVLARAWERYRTSDVVILGVLYQDDAAAGLEFMRKLGGTWPTVSDDNGRTALSFGVFGIPETFFITAEGLIAGRHVGAVDDATLVNGIEAIRTRTSR